MFPVDRETTDALCLQNPDLWTEPRYGKRKEVAQLCIDLCPALEACRRSTGHIKWHYPVVVGGWLAPSGGGYPPWGGKG